MAEEVKLETTSKELESKPLRDENGRLLPDQPSLNPQGRPLGSENFKTIFEKALKHLADANNKDPDVLYTEIVSNAIKSARGGDYRFYKDMLDRIYGTPTNKTDITTGGQPINEIKIKELASSIFNDNQQGKA